MIRKGLLCAAAAMVVLVCTGAVQGQEDLRQKFGMRTMEAARDTAAAISLIEDKKVDEGLKLLDSALKREPNAQMAVFWKGIGLADSGRLDEAMEAYEAAINCRPAYPLVTVQAAQNLGLILGKLKRYDESTYWLSRAIMEDADNAEKTKAKSLRNLAVTLNWQNDFLSAAIAALQARQTDPEAAPQQMIEDFFRQAGNSESAVVLRLEKSPKTPPIARRTAPPELTAVTSAPDVDDVVRDLLPDSRGNYIIAIGQRKGAYYLIRLQPTLNVSAIEVAGKVTAASLTPESLYLVTSDPGKLLAVEPETGKVIRSFDLPDLPADSLAALPAAGIALLTRSGGLYKMDLATGQIQDMKRHCQHIKAHPNQHMAYGFNRKDDERELVWVGGRAIWVGEESWSQSSLLHFVVVRGTPLLAALRINAASNASRAVVSPDGQWVALVGGGGFRPQVGDKAGSGYRVPVYHAQNVGQLLGTFATDSYPVGFAFNPVTQQVAALREKDGHVYSLADPTKGQLISNTFLGAAAWSGDGNYLVCAVAQRGVCFFRNKLTAEDQARAGWAKSVSTTPLVNPVGTVAPVGKPIAEYADFKVLSTGAAATAAVQVAMKQGRTDKLPDWFQTKLWGTDTDAGRRLGEILNGDSGADGAPIRTYHLKALLKEHPDHAAALYHLATAQRQMKRWDDARNSYLAAVRADAGRSMITSASLHWLSQVLIQATPPDNNGAIYCLGKSLQLDCGNVHTMQALLDLLKKNKLDDLAAQVRKLIGDLPASPTKLGELPTPPPAGEDLAATVICRQSAGAIVQVRCGESSATGVCVGKPGLIVTNRHVIRAGGNIQVTMFSYQGDSLKKAGESPAEVLVESTTDDLVVLRLTGELPPTLQPLTVTAAPLRPGEKVFAIGNPGLGRQVLVQSVSEGIISSASRSIQDRNYIQHSAAINPGNSGGPLINQKGRIVGINTLVADLNNVGFAIPADALRKLFADN